MRTIKPGDRAYPIEPHLVKMLELEFINIGAQISMPDLVVVGHMLAAVASLTKYYLICSATNDKSPEHLRELMDQQKELFARMINIETENLIELTQVKGNKSCTVQPTGDNDNGTSHR